MADLNMHRVSRLKVVEITKDCGGCLEIIAESDKGSVVFGFYTDKPEAIKVERKISLIGSGKIKASRYSGIAYLGFSGVKRLVVRRKNYESFIVIKFTIEDYKGSSELNFFHMPSTKSRGNNTILIHDGS